MSQLPPIYDDFIHSPFGRASIRRDPFSSAAASPNPISLTRFAGIPVSSRGGTLDGSDVHIVNAITSNAPIL